MSWLSKEIFGSVGGTKSTGNHRGSASTRRDITQRLSINLWFDPIRGQRWNHSQVPYESSRKSHKACAIQPFEPRENLSRPSRPCFPRYMQDQTWSKFVLFARWLMVSFSIAFPARSSRMLRRFGSCAVIALSLIGCASRYSTEALHAMAPSADIVDVCTRMPTVEDGTAAWAYKMSSQTTVSDRNWDNFEQFAETADVIYRYDPNAPEESASRLPWPYQDMSCRTLSAWKTPPMPKGMHAIPISRETRHLQNGARLNTHAMI